MKGRYLDYGHMYEGKMVRKELDNITKNSIKLHDLLHDADDLPEWVNKKVFLANNYLKTATDYIDSKITHRNHTIKSKKKSKRRSKKNKGKK